jgi:hypothetical protein
MNASKPIAVIEWIDASFEGDTADPKELSPLMHLLTVGWLVREDRDSVSVAQEWCEKDGTVRQTCHIPRSGIVSMKRLPAAAMRAWKGR